jgi:surfeit locus 1 family protein
MSGLLSSRWLAVAGAAAICAVCLGLGHWQLDRLAEKNTWIAEMNARLELAPVPVAVALEEPAAWEFRRARADGTFDPGESVLVELRQRGGRSGVRVVTPLRLPGREEALLVDRGFVPSQRVGEFLERDLPPEERGEVRVEGILRPLQARALPPGEYARRQRWYRLDLAGIQRQVPYPLAPVLLVRGEAPAEGALPVGGFDPPRTRVNHLHYAITWYSMAAIAAAIGLVIAARGIERGRASGAGR